MVGHYADCSGSSPSFVYYLATHLANSVLWVAAYQSLETLKPGSLVKLSVLDFFLSWKSYQSQHSGDSAYGFYYLNTETIQKLSGNPDHDNPLVKKCLGFDTQPINHAPVIFLVTFRQNTYFLALFDFSEKKALILGRHALQQLDSVTAHAEWESWNGPVLWKRIGRAFNWLPSWIQPVRPTVVYEANWIPVHFAFGIFVTMANLCLLAEFSLRLWHCSIHQVAARWAVELEQCFFSQPRAQSCL